MWLIDFGNGEVNIEDYKRYSVVFRICENGMAHDEFIWVEDNYMGTDFGWQILGVGLNYPPWNINHKIEGEF